MASLGDILGSKSQTLQASPAPVAQSVETAPSAEPTQADATAAESVEPQNAAATTAAQPANEDKELPDDFEADSHPVPRKALIAERKKRQEEAAERQRFERRAIELEAQVRTLQQFAQPQQAQPKAPAEEAPNFYADPERYISRQLEAVKAEQSNQRMSMSAAMVRTQHPDYDEVLPAFMEAVRNAPYLEQQVMQHPHPAMFAYETGKTYLEARKYGGSLEEMKKKMREELRAEVEAEVKKAVSVSAAENANKSTAGARGTGAATAAQFTGPTPLDSILPRDRFVKRRA